MGVVTGTIDAAADEAVLCPPSGEGQPLQVSPGFTTADVQFTRPAMFGPRPDVSPARATSVDLDSFDPGMSSYASAPTG